MCFAPWIKLLLINCIHSVHYVHLLRKALKTLSGPCAKNIYGLRCTYLFVLVDTCYCRKEDTLKKWKVKKWKGENLYQVQQQSSDCHSEWHSEFVALFSKSTWLLKQNTHKTSSLLTGEPRRCYACDESLTIYERCVGVRRQESRAHVTVSKQGGRPSPAWCRSPFSHSWPSAEQLLPLWSPLWPTPSCHWWPSCPQTCGHDDQEEEQADWGQSSTGWK